MLSAALLCGFVLLTPARALSFPLDAPLAGETPASVTEVVAELPPPVEQAKEQPPPEERPWGALGGVSAVNVAVWATDWFLLKREWARVGLDTWGQNLKSGFVWDRDEFDTNQFGHPYHGSLYYNAARGSGYGHGSSLAFTFIGSLQWEFLAENERPSVNDLMNTTLGGSALGEVLFRLSSLVLDDRTAGLERVRREVLAGLINPMRGVSRLGYAQAWRRGSRREDEPPAFFATNAQVGYLKVADGAPLRQGRGLLFAELNMHYGDALRGTVRQPFDAFTLSAQLTTREREFISHAEVEGVLATRPLRHTPSERLLLGAAQHFEYTDTQEYKVGSQSFSAGLLYRHALPQAREWRAALHLHGLVLAGVSSEYSGRVGRNYDYGPGLGLQFWLAHRQGPWELVTLEASTSWVHTLNGAQSEHLLHDIKLQVDVPVYRSLGLGASLGIFQRDSFYRPFDPITRRAPQLRVFLSTH